jgi:CRISPR-associated protein Csb2
VKHLCVTVRWADDRYHGLLGRDGPREWPPSPFRLFQALVAGIGRSGALDSDIGRSLRWLEGKCPLIVAPRARPGRAISRFVPNNDGDAIPDRQRRLTGKTFRPTLILDRPDIHYLWRSDETCPADQLVLASRSLCCLGWGIDMAHADCRIVDEEQIRNLHGIRWFPRAGTTHDDGLLRVPASGSMDDLRRAHESALGRIQPGQPLHSVHKPEVFETVFYGSEERPLGRPVAVFRLRTVDDDWFRYPQAKSIHVAGMTRRAAIQAMTDFRPKEIQDVDVWVESFVAGHFSDRSEGQDRFSYIPLYSIGHEHADAMVRRVMITAPFGYDVQLEHLAKQLDGVQLEVEDGSVGPILDRPRIDDVSRMYLEPSISWASVSPVTLPGHDDHKPEKTRRLIQRALHQSGIENTCEFTWSALPNFPHCLPAHKYGGDGNPTGYFRPKYLEGLTAVHVRLQFQSAVAGPLSIGAGRHCGLGILANFRF